MTLADNSTFKISTLSAVVFVKNSMPNGQTVVRKLPEKWFSFFDGDPVMIPLPDGAPRELPSLILRSKDQRWTSTFTSERITFQWAMVDGGEASVATTFFDQATEYINDARKVMGLDIWRVAAVSHRFIPSQDPGRVLASHFCKENWLKEPLNRPENFELHAHKKYTAYDNLEVNSWVRAKSSILATTKEKIIIVQQDINTLADIADSDFSTEDVGVFFKFIPDEFQKILGMYFPSQEAS